MKRVHLITRAWIKDLLREKLARPIKKEVIPLSQILDNAIKMQAISTGSKIRFS